MNSVLSSIPVTFTAPMPGLEMVEDFALRSIDSAPGLFALESGSAPVRLFLADAALFVPGYHPPLPVAAREALELGDGEAPQLLVVVNHSPSATTVNLMAPIVLNPASRRCTQLVLDGKEYPLRAELGAA
ncbi:flagellar assembly protein FliW [Arthrobacter sp. Hor0625]|uniref:flagellar assembly protein FliW n=1 Tax=Arthrobacter sp. Hor0625 TaxID=3457358 RepID=UPI00403EAF71